MITFLQTMNEEVDADVAQNLFESIWPVLSGIVIAGGIAVVIIAIYKLAGNIGILGEHDRTPQERKQAKSSMVWNIVFIVLGASLGSLVPIVVQALFF